MSAPRRHATPTPPPSSTVASTPSPSTGCWSWSSTPWPPTRPGRCSSTTAAPCAGIAVVLGAVVLVGVALAVALGLLGTSPGKAAVGLRVVDEQTGAPIGVAPALLRTLVLGVAGPATVGLGVATLAWTAVMDATASAAAGTTTWPARSSSTCGPPPSRRSRPPSGPAPSSTSPRCASCRPRRRRRARSRPGSGARAGPPAHADPAPPPPGHGHRRARCRQPPVAPARPVDARRARRGRPAVTAAGGAADAAPGRSAVIDRRPLQPVVEPDPDGRTPRHAALAGGRAVGRDRPPRPACRSRHAARAQPRRRPRGAPAAPGAGRSPSTPVEAFIVDGFTLVGRNPEPRAGRAGQAPGRPAVQDMSLSKTHAQFQVVPDGALVVMDRGSTNGSILIRGGVPQELGPGRPAALRDGDRVRFGDREMRVVRDLTPRRGAALRPGGAGHQRPAGRGSGLRSSPTSSAT